MREQVSNMLEGGEAAFLRSPVFVMRVVSQPWQGQQHAQLVEGVFVTVGLHLLHHVLQIVPIDS